MLVRMNQLGLMANVVCPRANAGHFGSWHRTNTGAIATVGTEFKPYHQRPKETLL